METLSLSKDLEPKVFASVGQCALFRALKPEQLPQLVKVAELQRFDPGEAIVKQGEASDSFYVVIDGLAAVTVTKDGGEVEIGEIPLPSSVGEVSLLLDEPRTASVTAKTPVTALKFSGKAFEAMFQKIPQFGSALASGLAHRLHQISGRIEIPEMSKPTPPPAEVLDLLPMELIQRHRVLPLKLEENVITLGVVDAPTTQMIKAVHDLLPSLELKPVQIKAEFFNDILNRHGGVKGFEAKGKPAAPKGPEAPGRSPRLEKLLERVVSEGASDLHLSAGHKPHWRVDGDMRAMDDLAVLGPSEVLELLEPVMEARHKQQFGEDNDTDLAYALPGSARFRVNVFRDRFGVSAVLRQIPSKIMTFEQLALPPVIKSFCELPKGLILVTGPTGSGKSTTLAAMIDYINAQRTEHVITIEDPIEFLHRDKKSIVNQREVEVDTRSFAAALRSALRQDPDVILVGEMRDYETIETAITAAETGHLVLSTLHTLDATETINRIISVFPPHQQKQIRLQLSGVLKAVISMRLVPRADGHGRVPAVEVMIATPFIRDCIINKDKTKLIHEAIAAGVSQYGMQTFDQSIFQLYKKELITYDEALRRASNPDEFKLKIQGIQSTSDMAAEEMEKTMQSFDME
jgi:twitching motility protein PilT